MITIKDNQEDMTLLINGLKQAENKKVQIGIFAETDGEVLKYAIVHEYGGTIKPKKKFIAIPLKKELKGKNPRDFDLKFIRTTDGKYFLAMQKGKQLEPYYLLVREVKIPERSFIRSTFDNSTNIDNIIKNAEPVLQMFLDGKKSIDEYLKALGIEMEGTIKQRIMGAEFQANSALTVNLKGENTPLKDSGNMLRAIVSKVI